MSPSCDDLSCCGAGIVENWLLGCHGCCWRATYKEHLATAGPGSCPRRFLATPLYEIFVSRLLATARLWEVLAERLDFREPGPVVRGRWVHDGRQDRHQKAPA